MQVTPAGPQPLSSDDGTKVTILRGTASGVINVPIDSAKPSDSIKASWGPTNTSEIVAEQSQFERNASVALPSRLEAELAAERAVTEALAKDLSWYQTVIDNPLAGSKSLAGYVPNSSPLRFCKCTNKGCVFVLDRRGATSIKYCLCLVCVTTASYRHPTCT